MRMPVPGEIFQGKYEIVDVLGRGGFAHVFRAIDVEVEREVAIKVLSPRDGGYSSGLESRFMREARVIAGLQDSHTITMFEFGHAADGLLYMVFEYVRGEDLAAVLRRGPLAPRVVEHILRQILAALSEAHQLGVLHRDIKPANVIVFEYMDDPYQVKLIDFGIAKPMLGSAQSDPTNLTRDGAVIGTPRYMAPEQFFGESLTPRADLYSLGLVAHEMLVGRPAIAGDSSRELIERQVSRDPIQLPAIRGAEVLSSVVDQMTAREPEDRFSSADEVLVALDAPVPSAERAMPAEPQRLPTTASAQPPDMSGAVTIAAPPRRHRWLPMVLGVASLGVMGAMVVHFSKRARQAPPDREIVIPSALTKTPKRPTHASSVAPAPPAPAPARDAGVDAADAPDGCGRPASVGKRALSVRLGFHTRSFAVYIPRGYDPDVRHRAVLMFHSAMRTGDGFIDGSTFNAIADREGLVLIAPNAEESTSPWHTADDLELTHRAIEESRRLFCLDPAWLFAIGHGGGGRFARDLRCTVPFSAIATTSSGQYVDEEVCESDPTPFIRIYGDKDKHVPYKGGDGCYGPGGFMSADDIAEQWRARNRCRGRSKKWIDERGGTCLIWQGDAAVASCRLHGGHDWPTSPAALELPGCGADPADFPLPETIWKFFAEQGRNLDE